MCRLLGWATARPAALDDLLGAVDLSAFTGLSRRHADGWGVAQATRRGVAVRKQTGAAADSPAFGRLIQGRRADLGLAHLRRATVGAVTRDNTHPFSDGRVAFAHNGSVLTPAAIDGLLRPDVRRLVRGTTDSERYFLAVLERLRDGVAPEHALRTAADDIATVSGFTSLNCLLLTPQALYAHRRVDPAGPVEDDDPDYYALRYRMSDGAVVVASSGWGTGWSELGEGDVLVVRRGTLETAVLTTARAVTT
jgi:predicted glutamine amidotransferase